MDVYSVFLPDKYIMELPENISKLNLNKLAPLSKSINSLIDAEVKLKNSLNTFITDLNGAIEKFEPSIGVGSITRDRYDANFDIIDNSWSIVQELDVANNKLQEIIEYQDFLRQKITEKTNKLSKIFNAIKLDAKNVSKFGALEDLKPHIIKKYKQNPIEMDTMMRDVLQVPTEFAEEVGMAANDVTARGGRRRRQRRNHTRRHKRRR